MATTFAWPVRVFYEDTDAIGIVYHSNYLNYMERARSAWIWDMGFDFADLAKEGIIFVVKHIDIDFKSAATLKEALVATAQLHHVGKTSITLYQTVQSKHDPSIIYAQAHIKIVTINRDHRPTAFPEKIIEQMR